jgi:hypothetical protein
VYLAVGRLTVGKLHGGDTQTPDVCFEIVACFLNNLWRHPEWSADKGQTLRLDVGQLGGDSKVGNLDSARAGQEDISSLDISVNLASIVQVIKT